MRRCLPLLAVLAVLAVAGPARAASAPSIVGGDETAATWPWMVYLDQGRQEIDLGDNQFCGGSLIAPTWVLTAAHCISFEELDPLITTVVIGRHAISDESAGERIQAKRILVNPQYSDRGDDVALIELERAPANPQPVKIAGPLEGGLWTAGTAATILGWGLTSDGGDGSDVLKEAQVPIVADDDCGRAYADPSWSFNPAIMVCAGYPEGGTDTCQGDSGGPMVVRAPDGTWRQVGVTSFGEGCARAGYPGVYSEIGGATLRDWVAGYVPEAVGAPAPAAATTPASAPAGSAPAPASAPATKPAAKRAARKCKRPKRRASRKAKARYRRCVKRRRAAARRR
jgi:secreted trypsin-like serine protease